MMPPLDLFLIVIAASVFFGLVSGFSQPSLIEHAIIAIIFAVAAHFVVGFFYEELADTTIMLTALIAGGVCFVVSEGGRLWPKRKPDPNPNQSDNEGKKKD